MKEKQDLANVRRNTMVKFLETRNELINFKTKHVKHTENRGSDWNISFESMSAAEQPYTSNDLKIASAYKDIIHDPSTFICGIVGSCDDNCEAMNIAELYAHDTFIWNQIQEKLFTSDESSLKMESILESIAIADNGNVGFAEFKVNLGTGQHLFSETVKITFDKNSNKMLSFTGYLTSNELSQLSKTVKTTRQKSSNLIGYPSVISLDHNAVSMEDK